MHLGGVQKRFYAPKWVISNGGSTGLIGGTPSLRNRREIYRKLWFFTQIEGASSNFLQIIPENGTLQRRCCHNTPLKPNSKWEKNMGNTIPGKFARIVGEQNLQNI